tara:strand:- start:2215 stop:2625 length:411 start_codon:yes stop_codon:yes gene_type:complete
MFFSLPLDVQKHINEFDDDFRVMKLVIIRNILRHRIDKNGNDDSFRACDERISNINNIIYKLCTHTYVNIWNDGDYHKPSYEYICKTCNADVTRYTSYYVRNMAARKASRFGEARLYAGARSAPPHNKKRIYKHIN